MPGVFISYSRADLGAVQPLERALQAHDIAVWRDEVFLSIDGERHYLWRAVDQDGHVLALLVQRPRDQKAAKTSFRKLLKGLTYVPRVIITDQLKSYGAAKREMLPSVDHRQHRRNGFPQCPQDDLGCLVHAMPGNGGLQGLYGIAMFP